jgi:tRNA/rRNA methyltransferase
LAGVRIVLVRPETPANIGASARAARNAGLSAVDLVEPGDWRTVECWRTAWGAHDLLESARVFSDLSSALAESSYTVALSGKRDAAASPIDVREMAAQVAALGGSEVASIVFGPETTGLTRAELALCGRRALIPSHPSQPSLNLSHAVMVAAYEVYRAVRRSSPAPRRATHADKERMLDLLRAGLLAIEALPGTNTEGYFREWRGLFERADLTPKEVRLLEHMARKMAKAALPAATRG